MTAVASLFEQRLKTGNLSCRLAETFEQVAATVQELLASRGCTGDDVVRTDVQSSRFVGYWCSESRVRIRYLDRLIGPELVALLVVLYL